MEIEDVWDLEESARDVVYKIREYTATGVDDYDEAHKAIVALILRVIEFSKKEQS